MKNLSLRLLSFLIGMLILVSACKKDDEIIVTDPDPEVPEANTTIAALWKTFAEASQSEIKEDLIIVATVTANDASGNLYKQLYIQDETAGIELKINQSNLSDTYKVGDEIIVYLEGMFADNYAGMVQLGSVYEADGETNFGGIQPDDISRHIERTGNTKEITTEAYNVEDLEDALLGTLITVKNIQVEASDQGATWSESSSSTNRTFTDCFANTLVVRTSSFADFKSEILPDGAGTLTGIYSTFNGTQQMVVRSLDDVDMTEELCDIDNGGVVDPENAVYDLYQTESNNDLFDRKWTAGEKVYFDFDGVKLGTSKDAGSITSNDLFTGKRKVIIYGLGWNGSAGEFTVKINDEEKSAFLVPHEGISGTNGSRPLDYTEENHFAEVYFEVGDTPSTIEIINNDRIAIYKIAVETFEGDIPEGPEATLIDIASLRNMPQGPITTPYYIEATVSLNGASNLTHSGNLYVQDESAGIVLRSHTEDLSQVAGKIKLEVTRNSIADFNGLVQISGFTIDDIEVIDPSATVQPKEVALADVIDGMYESVMVKIEDVEFIADEQATFGGENKLSNCTDDIIVNVAPDASFASTLLPAGRGTFVGLASIYNNHQLIVLDPSALNMTAEKQCEEEEDSEEPEEGEPSDYMYVENFDNSNLAAGYSDGSFDGVNNITWSYVASRDENGDANGAGIDGNAIMLRRSSEPSSISATISGGISNFKVKLYKGFTGAGDRQVELFINGVSIAKSTAFDEPKTQEVIWTVNDINVSGEFTMEIRNITSKQIILDDISWNPHQ